MTLQWNYAGDVTVGDAPAPGMVGQYSFLRTDRPNGISTLSQSLSIVGLNQLEISFD